MPDSGQDLISPAELFGGLENLCAHYVLSDLRLLSDSLDGLRNPGAIEVPCILNAPAMDARLTFDYSVNEEKKILLGLRRRKRSERVARFDVHMKLCPTAGAGSTDPGPARLYGTWPLFIEPAGTGRSFSLVLDKTVRLRVRMPEADEFDAATIETEKVW